MSRTDAIFIGIEVADDIDPQLGSKLEEVCPVNIFKGTDTGVEIVKENIDECVLCRLCLDAAPAGAVKVLKLYDGQSALIKS